MYFNTELCRKLQKKDVFFIYKVQLIVKFTVPQSLNSALAKITKSIKSVKKDHQKNTNHKFNFWFFTLDRLREICFDIECYN